jgi:hypothetical protein
LSEESTQLSPGPLRWLCWLPLASLLAVEVYVRGFDGWGAWAAAPLLLVPGLISLALVVAGLISSIAAMRRATPCGTTLLCTFVASLPMIWLGIRRFLV